MATGVDSIPAYASSTGWLRYTIERYLRVLRERGRLPTGKQGGGRYAVHFTAEHQAISIEGFGGYQPSDAADAADVLGALVAVEQSTVRPDQDGKTIGTVFNQRHLKSETFRQWKARQIRALADPAIREAARAEIGDTGEIALCVNPPSATVSWRNPSGELETIVFEPDGQPGLPFGERRSPNLARRVTILPFAVLLTAGELFADTLAYERAKATKDGPKLSGIGDDKAPGNESGAPGRAPLRNQPPRQKAEATDHTLDILYIERLVAQALRLSVGPSLFGVDQNVSRAIANTT